MKPTTPPPPVPSKVEGPRECREPHRQPIARPGEQLPEQGDEQDRAAREWLRHLNVGRLG